MIRMRVRENDVLGRSVRLALEDLFDFSGHFCHGGVDHHTSSRSRDEVHIAGRWDHRNCVIDLDWLFLSLAENARRQSRSENDVQHSPNDSIHRFLLATYETNVAATR